jgi:AMP nucleosidase
MNTKEDIVNNWLPRYTGNPLENFGEYILLTNFINYVEMFAEKFDVEINGKEKTTR